MQTLNLPVVDGGNRFLALKIVVSRSGSHSREIGNVPHGGQLKAALAKQLEGLRENQLPGSFADRPGCLGSGFSFSEHVQIIVERAGSRQGKSEHVQPNK